jgi:glutamyl-tRNA synthetase
MSSRVTRLAPSPTGALHLGNARTFLLNALLAWQHGWRVHFRMEDLDGPRTKPGAARQAIEELQWLGLTWDQPIVHQSDRDEAYLAALSHLIETGLAYPCVCSRKDVAKAASAPHDEDRQASYAGTCRGRFASAEEAQAETGRPVAWRVHTDDEPVLFDDAFAGPQSFRLSQTCGDFVIYRNEALAGYQLAVVVDDAAAGVTDIIRGDDLLESAARQIRLRRLLGLNSDITYYHLPLVVGHDGLRLAKRHGDTKLATYIAAGVSANRMLGLLGFWSGLLEKRRETDMDELRRRFEIGLIPKTPIVFTPQDEAFLK